MTTPQTSTSDEVRQLALGYLRRTGMAPADFARRLGYGYSTINFFLTGKYRKMAATGEERIASAILLYLDANPITTTDEFVGKLYEIGNVRAMRQVFSQLAERPCIYMAYAPPGSGKTDVARALIRDYKAIDPEVHIFRIYCRSGIRPRDLMRRVAIECGSVGDCSIDRTLNNLRFDFGTARVVLYFDEAQHLSVECFETIRELFDELHWSLCFAGSHELDRVFSKWAGSLEQLERRITDKVSLPAVTAEEATGIIRSEIPTLGAAQIRATIERSTVNVRVDKTTQRYLSIGRVMANIGQLQKALAEAASETAPAATTGQKVEAIA
jgi:DNA transposition AAA+ family ATPase